MSLQLTLFLLSLLSSITEGGKFNSFVNVNGKVSDYSSVSSTITVSGLPTTLSTYGVVRVYSNIAHSYSDDVRLRIYCPDGTYKTISEDFGSVCDNWFLDKWIYDGNGFRYGDDWPSVFCPTPGAAPYESFSYFKGRIINGEWKLDIYDDGFGNSGMFYSWGLEIEDGCIGNPCQNGGICTSTGMSTFSCACSAGWTGNTCVTDVNECSNNPCHAKATCTNNQGSFTCACNPGYSGNGFSCSDINECTSISNNCASGIATCTNTDGSFTCACNVGYSGSGTSCSDINECTNGSNNCHPNATCANSIGSFTCACKSGFSGNGIACTDINECTSNTNNCASGTSTCTNTIGSFSCACKAGYSGNGVTCNDINECTSNTHNCASGIATCTNTVGSFTCACNTGYSGTGTSCTDINECTAGTHNCASTATCTNTVGSFTCACNNGYSGNGISCTDVNECVSGNNCHLNATCTNTVGSFSCACKSGFSGNGITCTDINECTSNTHNCASTATCTNTIGSFTCACNTGYSGNGTSCTDINECTLNTHNCASGTATCTNSIGSFSCACNTGYSGNGVTCTDVNECTAGTHNCNSPNGVCSNTIGSFSCACKSGFSGNGVSCTNNNECTSNTHNCASTAICNDTVGSFTCTCKTGYSGDGVTCADVNECTAGTHNCDPTNGICTNTLGSFSCACKNGFLGNGINCVDIDECASNSHNCSLDISDCRNYPGGFLCNCKNGTTSGSNGCEDINECLLGTAACDLNAICTNTLLSYNCTCKPGFSGNGSSCTDNDECELHTANCNPNANCINTPGSFSCACKSGYFGDGVTCSDYNECQHQGGGNNCSAVATCTNTAGSFLCACSNGYSGNGVSCIDNDECALNSTLCHADANCTNTVGSFYCTCLPGFQGNGFNCADLNECAGENGGNTCSGNGFCINHAGGYGCQCIFGYDGDGFNCTDMNECDLNYDNCHVNATCTNTPGSYSCACNVGFFGDGVTCTDFNECTSGTHNCDKDATCGNTIGSFTCTCNSGFYGDGVFCTDYNECTLGSYSCHSNATCVNTPGSYSCSCKPGFTGNGSLCTDLNECIGENGGNNCSSNAVCTNTAGGFYCTCKSGFVGNGLNCNDINECGTSDPCDPNARCTNLPGTFACHCQNGYYGDGLTCFDVDECGNNIDTCSTDGICTNTVGSYSCACKIGYSGNGYLCNDQDECSGEGSGANCNPNAQCFNTIGSFNCLCNPDFVGNGVTCIPLSIPSTSNLSSFSVTVDWNLVPGASSYAIILMKSGVQVFTQAFPSSVSSSWISGLQANTEYTIVLTTFAVSDSRAESKSAFFKTHPAPLASVQLRSLAYDSVGLAFAGSSGATEYSADISLADGSFVARRFLSVVALPSSRKRDSQLLGTLSDLEANTDYNLRIFAGSETIGIPFIFQTAPKPVSLFTGTRNSATSILLKWNATAGATSYFLMVDDLHGGVVNFTFSSTPAYIVSSLIEGQQYTFTLYAGNSFGIDFTHGVSTVMSTTTVVCDVVTEDHALWPRTLYNTTAYGSCLNGYGGKPFRLCLAGETMGVFGPIKNPCLKLPLPPLKIAADPYDTKAIVSWTPSAGCTLFNTYVVLSNLQETPVNNGYGLLLTSPFVEIGSLVPRRNYTIKIYCGNEGGFESLGSTITFQTYISPPIVSVNKTTETNVSISWTEAKDAEWYQVKVTNSSEAWVVESKTNVTSLLIDRLNPGKNYTITVYSGMGASDLEPHGFSVRIKTLGGSSELGKDGTALSKILGGVMGGILGIVLVMVVIFAFFVYRRHKLNQQMRSVLEKEMSIQDPPHGAHSKMSLTRRNSQSSRRSSARSTADPTLLNTRMEISVPGFLLLDATTHFRVEGKIGTGGAGTVFKGTLLNADLIKQHNEKIAIKMVEKVTSMTEEDNKERFLQEVSIMWSCTFHQNIVKLIGYTLEPEFYILTKLYEIDLFTLIHHPNEEISSILAVKISNDIAAANAYLQEIGIVHRDLKSSNVLLETVPVNATQSMIRAVLCDFGLAKITNSANTIDNLKIKETRGFSPRYTAPEVFANTQVEALDAEIETKADVYSFGVIIWELLTRQVPWDGLEHKDIEKNVRNGIRLTLPLDDNQDEARTGLIELAKLCWQNVPSNRPTFAQIQTKLSAMI